VKFFSVTAKVLFPPYAVEAYFQEKFTSTMMTYQAYAAEIEYWKCMDPDYTAIGHQNMNIDNAYFWRDADGVLDCGNFDWGGLGNSCVGHKCWWIINCADFDQVKENLSHYLDVFVDAYRRAGGPTIDRGKLERMVLLTALGNIMFMTAAVPNCFKMCGAAEWPTIKDRHDPRVAGDIDGKSTLRTTLHVLNAGLRVLEELRADEVLQAWIDEVWVGHFKLEPKPASVIFGTAS